MGGHRLIQALAICTSIFCLSTTPVSSADSPVPATFSAVFMQCIRAENLPAIENESEILKVLLTISQSNRFFMSFLDCMGNKTATFRNSNDSTEWYLARVFNKNYAKMFWDLYKAAANSSADDISCLTSMGKMDQLENCLRNVTIGISMIKKNHSAMFERMPDKQFQTAICSTLKAAEGSSPKSCFSVYDASKCTRVLEQFLASFITMVSCNNSYSPTTTTSTTPSPTPYSMPVIVSSSHSSRPMPQPSALFSCLSIVYPGKLFQMLFPPSEIILSSIKNLTLAQLQHEMDMDDFCGNISKYSQCIRIKLTDPVNSMDTLLAKYVDTDNFEKALSEYCSNKELVKSNFQCTYRSTSQAQVCNGGMNEVITTMTNSYRLPVWSLCRQFKAGRECRVNKQLKVCNIEFATVMEKVMTGVLSEQCRAGEIIFPENEMTDLLPCFASYLGEALDRRPKDFGNPNKRPDANEIMQFALKEIAEICSNKDALFSCLTRKLKSSTKKIDQFMKQMFSVDNMIKIMDFSCAMIPDIQKDSTCLVEYLDDATNINNYAECITNATEKMTMNMTSAMNASSELPGEPLCEGMGSILDCYGLMLSKCDRKIVGKVNELVDATKKSCGDLNYKLEFQSESAGAMNSLAPLTLALITLAYHLV